MLSIFLTLCTVFLSPCYIVGRCDELQEKSQDNTQQNSIDSMAKKPVNELIECLKQRDFQIRFDACLALARNGIKAQPALSALIRALEDPEVDVRWSAASAIGEIGPQAVTAVPSLIKALGDADKSVRQSIAISLGKIGPTAKSAVPALIKLLDDKESDVRSWAATSLGDIGQEPKIVVPALATALRSEEMPCRYFGSMAFYGNRDVKRAIATSLSCFGTEAVPVLIALLDDPSKEVRWCALYALGLIGPKAKTAADAICKSLQDKEEVVSALAVVTMMDVDVPHQRAIPLLIESLKHQSGRVRFNAAESLGQLGPKANAAIPLLIEVYRAKDIRIGGSQWVIGEAIKKIDPDAARREDIDISAKDDKGSSR